MRWFRKSKISACSTGSAGGADGATVVPRLVRAAVEVAGAVPELDRGLLGHRGEPDGLGDGAAPDRPGGVGLRQCREAGHGRQGPRHGHAAALPIATTNTRRAPHVPRVSVVMPASASTLRM